MLFYYIIDFFTQVLYDTLKHDFKFEFIKGGDRNGLLPLITAEARSGGNSGIDFVTNYTYYGVSAAIRDCYENVYNVSIAIDFRLTIFNSNNRSLQQVYKQ